MTGADKTKLDGLASYWDRTGTTVSPTNAGDTIATTGRIGAGTTSPSERLHIDGLGEKILATPVIYGNNQDSAYLIAGSTSYTGAATNWGTYGFQHRLKSNASGEARITVDNYTGELFTIENTGNVGINTADPETTLRVNGTTSSPQQTITAGAFDLATGNFWTAGAITIPNPTNAVAGTSGLIILTGAPTGWGANFAFPGGTAVAPTSFPALVPFYVQGASTILVGNPTEGIV